MPPQTLRAAHASSGLPPSPRGPVSLIHTYKGAADTCSVDGHQGVSARLAHTLTTALRHQGFCIRKARGQVQNLLRTRDTREPDQSYRCSTCTWIPEALLAGPQLPGPSPLPPQDLVEARPREWPSAVQKSGDQSPGLEMTHSPR